MKNKKYRNVCICYHIAIYTLEYWTVRYILYLEIYTRMDTASCRCITQYTLKYWTTNGKNKSMTEQFP